MKAKVDESVCTGCGVCADGCPSVFKMGDDNMSKVIVDVVPAGDEDKVRVVHAMRMAARIVKDRTALHRLFDEVGPRFVGRRGGYLRITKVGFRAGDAAPVSIVELVDRAPASAEG